MSQYTTGEMAKLCGITVRAVQYYDGRGILSPSALSEGGRRLYSDDDLKRLKIICFLRELGLSIDAIGKLLSEEDPGSVIYLLLRQQEQILQDELTQRRRKLDKLTELQRELKSVERFSLDFIGDIAHTMENKNNLKKLHLTLLFTGLPISLLQIACILLGIFKGLWWTLLIWLLLAVVWGVFAMRYYHGHAAYICPQCHTAFRPGLKEMVFASHTPRTRKLTCTACGHHGFCVETWGPENP